MHSVLFNHIESIVYNIYWKSILSLDVKLVEIKELWCFHFLLHLTTAIGEYMAELDLFFSCLLRCYFLIHPFHTSGPEQHQEQQNFKFNIIGIYQCIVKHLFHDWIDILLQKLEVYEIWTYILKDMLYMLLLFIKGFLYIQPVLLSQKNWIDVDE